MEVAKPLAMSNNTRFRHVSLIVNKSNIVSVGINSRKTHPLAQKHGYRFDAKHSELDAYLRLTDKNMYGLILVNFRFNCRGQLRNSKPCQNCLSWCKELFDEIWFSHNDGMHKL